MHDIVHSLKDGKLQNDKVKRHKEIAMLKQLRKEKKDEDENKYDKELAELKLEEKRNDLIDRLARRIKYDQVLHGDTQEDIAPATLSTMSF